MSCANIQFVKILQEKICVTQCLEVTQFLQQLHVKRNNILYNISLMWSEHKNRLVNSHAKSCSMPGLRPLAGRTPVKSCTRTKRPCPQNGGSAKKSMAATQRMDKLISSCHMNYTQQHNRPEMSTGSLRFLPLIKAATGTCPETQPWTLVGWWSCRFVEFPEIKFLMNNPWK